MFLNTVRHNKGKTVGVTLAVIFAIVAVGATSLHISPLSWGWYQPYDTQSDLALAGYDPVAYHTAQRATKGLESLSYEWSGVTWRFATAESQDLFAASPTHYAPQFGGHCAKAVASGLTAKSDPEIWHIADGALYVFANAGVKEEWIEALPKGSLSAAQANWSAR